MPSMSLIWLNVIVSLSSEAFGHRSFSGTSCLLERELLWPEEWVAQPQVQLGRRGGSRPTLLLTEGWRRPVIHRGRSLRSGHQVHLEARVTRGRVKRALPSVAPLWGCRQGQDAARSSPPAQSVRKRSRSDWREEKRKTAWLPGLRGTGMPFAKPASTSMAQPGCLCPLEQMHPPWRGHSGPCPPLPGHSAGTACLLLTRTTWADGKGMLSEKSQSQEDSVYTAFPE